MDNNPNPAKETRPLELVKSDAPTEPVEDPPEEPLEGESEAFSLHFMMSGDGTTLRIVQEVSDAGGLAIFHTHHPMAAAMLAGLVTPRR